MSLPAEGEIRWGTGNDNALAFAYPADLDDVRMWRRPAPGSRTARNPAGTSDSWIQNRDFVLAGTARWFRQSLWGGLGLQDFLDWATAKNTFRFIPDRAYPSFYVDNCYLDEPFDDPAPNLEESDGSQSIPLVIRQQAFDFSLAVRGLLFEYVAGKPITDPSTMLATFTRASIADRRGRDGILASAAVNALRDRHFAYNSVTGLYEMATLLEPARTNLVIRSDELATSWTATGAATPTNAYATHGGISFSRVTGIASEDVYQTVAFTGDGDKAFSIILRTDGATGSTSTGIRDATAGTWRARADVTVAADGSLTVVAGAGTLSSVETLSDKCYRISMVASAVVAANTNRVHAVSGNGTLASLRISRAMAENAVFPTSDVATAGATASRSADLLSFPFGFVPQEMTVYCKFIDKGSIISGSGANPIVFEISSSADAGPRVLVYRPATYWQLYHQAESGGSTVTSTQAAAPTFGDTVELRCVLGPTGVVTLGQSINAAAEAVAAASAPLPLAPAWSGTTLWINHINGAQLGSMALLVLRVAAGTRTLAQMRAI